jgi:asparagine N-glycosylation enzyme membrane subunit Stt3
MTQNIKYVRWLAAIAVLVSAYVHYHLWADGMKDLDVVGPAFLLNAVGGVVIAVLLVTWTHWIPGFLTLGFGISTLGAFIIATTPSGFFDVHEKWVGGYVWSAAIAEAVAILTGAVLLLRDNPLKSRAELEHRSTSDRADLH